MHKRWLGRVFALSGLVISGWSGVASAATSSSVSWPGFRLAGEYAGVVLRACWHLTVGHLPARGRKAMENGSIRMTHGQTDMKRVFVPPQQGTCSEKARS